MRFITAICGKQQSVGCLLLRLIDVTVCPCIFMHRVTYLFFLLNFDEVKSVETKINSTYCPYSFTVPISDEFLFSIHSFKLLMVFTKWLHLWEHSSHYFQINHKHIYHILVYIHLSIVHVVCNLPMSPFPYV